MASDFAIITRQLRRQEARSAFAYQTNKNTSHRKMKKKTMAHNSETALNQLGNAKHNAHTHTHNEFPTSTATAHRFRWCMTTRAYDDVRVNKDQASTNKRAKHACDAEKWNRCSRLISPQMWRIRNIKHEMIQTACMRTHIPPPRQPAPPTRNTKSIRSFRHMNETGGGRVQRAA